MDRELMNLYRSTVPAWLREYADCEEMLRLRGIDMNCGMNYTSFPLFSDLEPYTRYEHSLGVALILCRFTDRKEVILSGLFHDIATPAFSHVIDFLNGDHETQESTEGETYSIIAGSPCIASLLNRDALSVSDVADYHLYSLADNDSPRLSADRLEYMLGNIVNYGYGTLEQVQRFLEDLCAGINEDGEEEMMFMHEDIAEEFALLAMKCGHIFSCNEDRYGMEFLAGILKNAVKEGILEYDDFRRTEAEVIALLMNSSMKDQWMQFTQMNRLLISEEQKEGYLQVHAKRRYIDPLCNGRRVSSYSEAYRDVKNAFLNENQEVWMRADNLQ